MDALKALEPIERVALLAAGNGDLVTPEDEIVIDRCVARGCLRWVEYDEYFGTVLTDLGRLALRVSVPGAPVPL